MPEREEEAEVERWRRWEDVDAAAAASAPTAAPELAPPAVSDAAAARRASPTPAAEEERRKRERRSIAFFFSPFPGFGGEKRGRNKFCETATTLSLSLSLFSFHFRPRRPRRSSFSHNFFFALPDLKPPSPPSALRHPSFYPQCPPSPQSFAPPPQPSLEPRGPRRPAAGPPSPCALLPKPFPRMLLRRSLLPPPLRTSCSTAARPTPRPSTTPPRPRARSTTCRRWRSRSTPSPLRSEVRKEKRGERRRCWLYFFLSPFSTVEESENGSAELLSFLSFLLLPPSLSFLLSSVFPLFVSEK